MFVMPNQGEILQIYLVVSDYMVSSPLVETERKKHRQFFYVNRVLLVVETKYSYMEKLVYALVISDRKLRPYFESHIIKQVTTYPFKAILHKQNLARHMAFMGN